MVWTWEPIFEKSCGLMVLGSNDVNPLPLPLPYGTTPLVLLSVGVGTGAAEDLPQKYEAIPTVPKPSELIISLLIFRSTTVGYINH